MAQVVSVIRALYSGIAYRGREGHWAWLMHRVGGIGIALFVALHVFDIVLTGFGPDVFNRFLFIYHSPPFRILVLLLLYGVLYHAMNGLRLIAMDFWPATTRHERRMFWAVLAVVIPVWFYVAFRTVVPLFGQHR